MAGPESQVGGLIAVGTGDALKCMQDLLVGACGARDGTVTCFPELSGAGVFVDGGTSKPYVNQVGRVACIRQGQCVLTGICFAFGVCRESERRRVAQGWAPEVGPAVEQP